MTTRRSLLAMGFALGLPLMGAGRAQAQSAQYTYDGLGRLKTVTYPNGFVVTYSYDAAGNRTQVHAGTGSPPPPPPPPPALTASLSPTLVYGDPIYPTSPVVATPNGGLAPFAYAWERVSGTATVVVDAASSQSTTFSYIGADVPPDKIAYWRCRVTDAAAQVAYTGNVKVQMVMS